jgi:molecular chaperone DnaJ
MAKRDYYDILEIPRDADEATIKSAYRKKAMQYHPDRNPGNTGAEERFKEATEAYEVLKDPQKRQVYDQYGHAGLGQGPGFGGFGGFGGFDIADALRAFMRDFGGGSIFVEFFGAGRTDDRRRMRRGEDLRIRVKLSLEEIATGIKKTVKVNRLVKCEECHGSGVAAGSSKKTCPQCKGSGRIRTLTRSLFGTIQQVTTCPTCRGTGEIIADPCKVCNGTGRVRGSSTVELQIPAGVSSGNYMTVENMGNAAPNAGEPGDLVVVFEEEDHELFTRHGDNVLYELPISFTQAALGGEIMVPTLGGESSLKIPQGTQSGKVLKLRGKGIPHLSSAGRGDELVQIIVWVPEKLSPQDKELLEKLSESETFRPPQANKSFFSKLRETLGV